MSDSAPRSALEPNAGAGWGGQLREARARVDQSFERFAARSAWHEDLIGMARHVLVGAGKAVRPALMYWAHDEVIASREARAPWPAAPVARPQYLDDWALALEMIHTYSLVHDDLPAMDNDALRRGKPTLHTLYGDAAAILTGDALLTGAFELLAGAGAPDPLSTARAVREVSRAAGGAGMVGGQMRDMFGVDRDLQEMDRTHREKTGALFGAALACGVLAATGARGFDRAERARIWGLELGLLFQIIDDILDATGTSATLGKSAGKDANSGKQTYLSLLGVASARDAAQSLRGKLIDDFGEWGSHPERALALLNYMGQRGT